eukprot:17122_1
MLIQILTIQILSSIVFIIYYQSLGSVFMGQQASTAYNFCCTACSACPCCTRSDYEKIHPSLMNDDQPDYQSNGNYDKQKIDGNQHEHKANDSHHHHHKDERTKFRAFIIAYSKQYGYLLLKAYKKGKGQHYQLPGGHIDKSELYGCSLADAAKMAGKRELFEETGLDIPLDRFKHLKNIVIKDRQYFQLLLDETDSLHIANNAQYDETQLTASLNNTQKDFKLKLSHEHNGFEFEKDIDKAIQMIKKHSGGKNSEALAQYAEKAKHERKRSRSNSHSKSQSSSIDSKKKKKKKKKDKKKKDKQKKEDKNANVET